MEGFTPLLFEDIKGSERPEIILANAPKFKELIMRHYGSSHKAARFKQ